MSQSLVEASAYLHQALRAIDVEMSRLQERLHDDARDLRDGIEAAQLSDADRARLLRSLDRVEKTAESVATFAHRHEDPPRSP